ncbi:tetratricopeptide repeat protein [Betaproteobacteria bacterium SCN1]|jgi:tetratricopeptide (TPR) repeat protein|nr:tetratricopeptide repeat protein [Betaproteobacteria bacterium SCN1]
MRIAALFALLAGASLGGSPAPAAAGVQTFGLEDRPAAQTTPADPRWVAQARALERRSDWPGLLALGQAWARSDPADPLAWFVQGRAYAALGRLAEAIGAYERNLRLAPDDARARNNLGNAWRDSGRPREALRTYRAAVDADPDYVQAWRNLGLTYYLAYGRAGVARALERLRTVDPALADVWRALAVDYAASGDPRVAERAVDVLRGLDAAQRKRLFDALFAED